MFYKTKDIQFSPIKRIQAEAEERGAVSLAQGIPRFLPPLGVRRAAMAAIEEGKADFYGPPQGIPELRQEISEWHLSNEKVFYDPEKEILVTAGALQGMSAALTALLSPGDELLIPSPSYVPFLNLPKVLGIKPVFVPLNPPHWRLRRADLKGAVTPKTKGIILCHPNNPTGTVYTRSELEEIADLAKKHDLWIFSDEVYRFFVDPKIPYVPLGEIKSARPRLIRIMSFSKAFSLSGWRVGYLMAEHFVTSEIFKAHEMMTTAGASLPAQYAALSALGDFPDLPNQFNQLLISRRERMRRRLQNLSPHFEFTAPQGAYYFFVKSKDTYDDLALARRFLEEAGVATVPGSAFGPGGEGYLRLSFAAKEGEIEEAFDRLERYLVSKETLPDWDEIAAGATAVTDDSRKVRDGGVFVAVRGENFDGHDFIEAALKKGASRVVGEQKFASPQYVRVDSSRRALGELAAAWHGHPSRKIQVIGVTGTDGKTTTSHLINYLLDEGQIPSSVMSTLNSAGSHTTTPSALEVQEFLVQAVAEGRKAAVLEVTSHGIAQERIGGTDFAGGVLTNVTSEHLDYHQTFEQYRQTKARFFKNVPLAILNLDDPSFEIFAKASGKETVTYSVGDARADFSAGDVEIGDRGSRFNLRYSGKIFPVLLPLPGLYNVSNALAALAAAVSLGGVPLEKAAKSIGKFDPQVLAGRFEQISGISDFRVVIDFAHTPNALQQVLNHAARVKPGGARLLAVFGAAGERDRQKRSQMGKIAARTADLAILTAEDPRNEDPHSIIDEIARGCFSEGAVEGKNFVRIADRREAIRFALGQARKNDLLLVLGKGHESTMAIKGVEHPWSDSQVVKEEFSRISR